uniref:Retrotransposon gag domain-containing protein n=1 Tax=Salix viminalis TaxID=40686 RepID=A0A6N2M428_SALVM
MLPKNLKYLGPYMFLNTTKDVWDAVKQTYSKVKDAALIYEIKTKLSTTKQGNMLVIKYYNIMKSLWLQLDYYQDFQKKCNDDATILKNYVEGKDFLIPRSMPSLNEVFSVIRAKEGRRTNDGGHSHRRKLHGKPLSWNQIAPTRMRRNGGFGWNQPRGHAHLVNAEETASETNTPEVRGLNKEIES